MESFANGPPKCMYRGNWTSVTPRHLCSALQLQQHIHETAYTSNIAGAPQPACSPLCPLYSANLCNQWKVALAPERWWLWLKCTSLTAARSIIIINCFEFSPVPFQRKSWDEDPCSVRDNLHLNTFLSIDKCTKLGPQVCNFIAAPIKSL